MIQSLKARDSSGFCPGHPGRSEKLSCAESSFQGGQESLEGCCRRVRLLGHDHMPGMRDEDETGGGHVFVEIPRRLHGGQLVLLATQDESREFDLDDPAADIKMITGLKIVEDHVGRALSGHADETLP